MHIAAKWVSAIIVAITITAASTSYAGDHVHQCRSADGLYSMNDEELQLFDFAKGRETGPAIPYKVLTRTDLSKSVGFCVADAAPKGQRRFRYAASTYALHIRFRQQGQTIKTFMLCEQASSGLPASYNCDKDVQTLKWASKTALAPSSADVSKKGSGPRWMHDGSEVRIVVNGRRRRIEFVTPNEGLANLGIVDGDVLFEGRRSGNDYIGKAYVYNSHCPAKTYKVSGRVQKGERRVVVTGRKPITNENCKVLKRQRTRLVFNRE